MKLIFGLALLLGCTALADTRRAPAESKDDAQWIEDLGGSVERNSQGKVTSVSLRGTWVTDTDLRRLTSYPDLNELDLSLTHVTDAGLQEIKNLKGITDFNLYFAEYVTDEGVAYIKDWKQLRRLNLHGTKASDTALEHIAGINTLESLDVGSTLMTDVGLERLTSLTNLRELTMGGNELGDAGLQALRQMPTLTYLDLSGRNGNDKNVWSVSMSNAGLQAVLALKDLRELRFSCASTSVGIEGKKLGEVSTLSITEKWLEQIKTLPKLERLKLQGCTRVDDQSVATLISMPALREADLKGTSVTDEGAKRLRAGKPGAIVYVGHWEGKAGAFRNN